MDFTFVCSTVYIISVHCCWLPRNMVVYCIHTYFHYIIPIFKSTEYPLDNQIFLFCWESLLSVKPSVPLMAIKRYVQSSYIPVKKYPLYSIVFLCFCLHFLRQKSSCNFLDCVWIFFNRMRNIDSEISFDFANTFFYYGLRSNIFE